MSHPIASPGSSLRAVSRGRAVPAVLALALLAGGCSAGGSPGPAAERPPPSGEPPVPAVAPLGPPPPELVDRLSLDTGFYAQYLDADGIPVVGSRAVSPFALAEAKWIIGNLLVNREDLVAALASSPVRVSVMAVDEFTTDVPEHSDLRPADYWDRRARGLGATEARPAVSAGEENLLELAGDPYSSESILVHELGHVIHEQGMSRLDPSFDTRLATLFEQARAEGLWRGTYAGSNRAEYFAEGVQSWFDTNRENDAEHNDVDTRDELVAHDPRLAALLAELFGDNAWRYRSPGEREGESPHLAGFDRAAAPVFAWPPELVDVDISRGPGPIGIPLENRVAEDWSGRVSPGGGAAASIGFDNRTAGAIRLSWIDFDGERVADPWLPAGERRSFDSFEGHLWEVSNVAGEVIGRFEVADEDGVAVLRDRARGAR